MTDVKVEYADDLFDAVWGPPLPIPVVRLEHVQAALAEKDQELARVKDELAAKIRSKNDCVIDLYRKLDKLDDLNLSLKQQLDTLLAEAVWPNVIAPAQYENPAPGWEDPKLPDFKLIWKLAREVGYAIGIHGSLKRDVDLIAAPWTDEATGNYGLIEHLCKGLPAKWLRHGEAPCNLDKPHGRVAVTLQIDGYYKPIDLSIMPRAFLSRPDVRERQERKLDGYAGGSLNRELDMQDAAREEARQKETP